MDRLSPQQLEEPVVAGSSGSSAARTTLYTVLVLLLAAGGWVRFNNQIASLVPALAAPATQQATSSPGIQSLLELGLVPRAAETTAVAALGLPAGDNQAMVDALKRDRLRLVQMPLFDAGLAAPDGGDAGRVVEVSSGGYTRLIRLSRQPVVLTLPIDRVGTVSFRVPGGEPTSVAGVGIGAMTATGPVRLPDLAAGQQLDVGVVAQ